jgi:hypothetical protein
MVGIRKERQRLKRDRYLYLEGLNFHWCPLAEVYIRVSRSRQELLENKIPAEYLIEVFSLSDPRPASATRSHGVRCYLVWPHDPVLNAMIQGGVALSTNLLLVHMPNRKQLISRMSTTFKIKLTQGC